MRHVIRRITLLIAALMIIAVPILAEEGAVTPKIDPALQGGKDECLLVAMNCDGRVTTFQGRIDRIQNEINKGTSVYTNEELKSLQNRLEGVQRELDEIRMPHGGA